MKYGVNLFLWTGAFSNDTIYLLPKSKELGFDGVEIPLIGLDDIDVDRTRKELESNGLECTTCCVVPPEANPISEDSSSRSAAAALLNRCIEMTAAMGGEVICGPLYAPVGKLVGRGRTDEEWKWCIDTLSRTVPVAEANSVTLALEPLNRFETYFLNTVADTVKLVEEINSPRVKVHIDPFHANIEEKDIPESIRACGNHLGHFHISENDRGIPGTGHTDWDGIVAALKDVGYDQWMVIESFVSAIKEIAAAASIWRDLAPSSDAIASEGLKFIKQKVS